MARGTFANIRLVNKFIGKAAPQTLYTPTKEVLFDLLSFNSYLIILIIFHFFILKF